MRMFVRSILILICLAFSLSAASAAADGPTSREAKAVWLFKEGKRLKDEGKWPEACAAYAESQRVDAAVGTLYFLGDCYEHIGKTASAWAAFNEVADLSRTAHQDDREAEARKRIAAIEPKLTRLSIVVKTPDLAGLEVKQDKEVISKAQWGAALPVDPGRHELVATAPGYESYTRVIEAKGEGRTVSFSIPELAKKADLPPPVTQTGLGTQRTVALVVGGVGVASLVAGGIFGALAMVGKDNSDGCKDTPNACTDDKVRADRDDARTMGTVSTITFIAGGVLAAGGAVLWFTAPKKSKQESAQQPTVGLSPTGSGLLLHGTF